MSIGKDKLTFDSTDADSLAASDTVGSYVLAGDDGTAIGHVSDALKVSLTNASIAVTATDLDIRDLAFATDSVDVSGSSVSITGDVNVTQGTSPWVVSGSVTATVNDAALANTAALSTATAMSDTATLLVASSLANRKYLTFQNLGPAAVYVGDGSVTAATGLRLANGAMLEGLRIGPAIGLKGITNTGAAGDMRILELS